MASHLCFVCDETLFREGKLVRAEKRKLEDAQAFIHRHLPGADFLVLSHMVERLPFHRWVVVVGCVSAAATVGFGQCFQTQGRVWWLTQREHCRGNCGSVQSSPDGAIKSEVISLLLNSGPCRSS